ncbi:TPA: hypothetical protein QEM47_004179 [Pseudomonas putida]|uniref:hypothetical protein n=1 Tax=Pseudomonas putida TaxID=303 RepID=UPI000AF26B9B|nr:hypothetical protein [Pseudomonas putida]MDD2120850.1 hypothetical protein [Pseudomonas putida]UPU92281.1 hypothetical protein M0766_26470 [Pseudomonas putida]HDS1731377.1 hypothetical protein [Pseudomonas putida]
MFVIAELLRSRPPRRHFHGDLITFSSCFVADRTASVNGESKNFAISFQVMVDENRLEEVDDQPALPDVMVDPTDKLIRRAPASIVFQSGVPQWVASVRASL